MVLIIIPIYGKPFQMEAVLLQFFVCYVFVFTYIFELPNRAAVAEKAR